MSNKKEDDRQRAIRRHANGESPAAIYGSMGYSHRWFYKWLQRYQSGATEWFRERSRLPHTMPRRTAREIEQIVIMVRHSLYNQGLFCGAQAMHWELEDLAVQPLPSLRSINRILARHELTHRRTGRYEPKGKKYPRLVGTRPGEVHQTDFVGPCYLKGPVRFYSLHSVDIVTGACAVQPLTHRQGQHTVDALWASWSRLGMPQHQQVDNEMVFYGSPAHPRGMGMLIRLCLAFGIEPWFIPPGEPWRNGVVEKFNDHWRQKFFERIAMQSEADLGRASLTFEQRHNSHYRYAKLGGKTPRGSLGGRGGCVALSPEAARATGAADQTAHGTLPPHPLHSQRSLVGHFR